MSFTHQPMQLLLLRSILHPPPRFAQSLTQLEAADGDQQTDTPGTWLQSGVKLSKKGSQFDGLSDTAMTLLARDYKGFGNQQMTGVIVKNE